MTDDLFEEGYRAYCAGEWDSAECIFSSRDDDRWRIALAYVYMDRDDGRADPVRTFELLHELAERGNLTACTDLGYCFAFGIGCEKSPEDAVTWYRLAADAGMTRAMNNLAVCYTRGSGTVKDPARAIALLEKCEEGDGMVLSNLGSAYAAAGDEAMAVRYDRKAAEAGDPRAIEKLRERGMDVSGYTAKDVDFGAVLFAELRNK